jgi:hypothetical protein
MGCPELLFESKGVLLIAAITLFAVTLIVGLATAALQYFLQG